MGITPLRFTGISNFSEDFQQILDRAVSIASLPVRQIQNDQAKLLGRKQELGTLRSGLASLATAVSDLGALGASRSLTATSTNTTRVSVQISGAAVANSYTITDISSVARKASETTLAGFATADATEVEADGVLELVVGGDTYQIDISEANTLEGLRDAINDSGAAVTATILNTGTGGTPYYLSATANATGSTTLELRSTAGSAASNLLTSTNQGADAIFKLNGLAVTKADNTVIDAIPGVTFTILDETEPDESVLLNLTSSRATLATALQTYVSAYNAAATAVKQQVGANAGLLSGSTIIVQAQAALRSVSGYFAAAGVSSLVDLGVELDKNGVMSFNSVKFYSLPTATVEAAFEFLGSATTGFGALSQKLTYLTDPVSGAIQAQQNVFDAADQRLSRQVEEISARIERMQAGLSARLQQADALLNRLEAQQSQLEQLFKALEKKGES